VYSQRSPEGLRLVAFVGDPAKTAPAAEARGVAAALAGDGVARVDAVSELNPVAATKASDAGDGAGRTELPVDDAVRPGDGRGPPATVGGGAEAIVVVGAGGGAVAAGGGLPAGGLVTGAGPAAGATAAIRVRRLAPASTNQRLPAASIVGLSVRL
jgi:hypothetical protein